MSMRSKVDKYCDDNEVALLVADGFDAAIIGVAHCFNKPAVCYDRRKCIKILMKDMTEENAEEYFDFNVIGSYAGEFTPVFLERL